MRSWPSPMVNSSFAALMLGLLVLGGTRMDAQVVTWTGSAWPDEYTNNPANWLGNTLPLNNGTEHFIFGQGFQNTVFFWTALNANKVTITGIRSPFLLDDDNDILNLGAGGFVYAPTNPVKSYIGAYGINLTADQVWDIQSGEVGFLYNYSLEGAGRLTKSGAGSLSLSYTSSWTGGITLNAGKLVLDTDFTTTWSLGTGNFIIGTSVGNPTLVTRASTGYDYPISVSNTVELNGILATKNEVELHLSGAVTLNNDTTINTSGRGLFLEGAIGESGGARKLTVNSTGTVVLSGANTYTGGTHVENGALVFAELTALPASPATNALTAAANGYVGMGDDTAPSTSDPQTNFIARFNKALTFGTVGFDTDPTLFAATIFTGPIDLTGFAATARLGSATKATLSGTITPQSTSYRFGGGGGFLQVGSILTGANSLVLDSPLVRPLTVRLTNDANNWSGGTSVTNSALIFGSAPGGSFSGAAGSVQINQGGFVGFEIWGDQTTQQLVDNSLLLINPASVGALGFEGVDLSTVNLNLGAFSNALFLASSDVGYIDDGFGGGTLVGGTITPAGGAAAPFRFAGYKGGLLEVISNLTGTNGIQVGDPNSPATFGDPAQEEYSTVALGGNNSGLSGDVILYAGQLGISQSNGTPGIDPTTALGTGKLIVQGMSLPPEWADTDGELPWLKLVVENFDTIIANDIVLNASLLTGGWPDFKLTGVISGTGGLAVDDGITLSLSGSNTFSGGVRIYSNSSLNLNQNSASGSGPLEFVHGSGATVFFNTTAPVIGGLSNKDQNSFPLVNANLSDTVLTINQAFDSEFTGEFRSSVIPPDDRFKIVKNGTGTLHLVDGGMYFYHGVTGSGLPGDPEVSLQVNQGKLVLGSNFYVESSNPTFWIHGGTLALDYASISNPLVIDNGGRITGNGSIANSVGIGSGATLAPGEAFPGDSPIGSLDFWHLDAKAGGTFEWDIMKADPSSAMWDQITISTPATLDFSTINLTDPNTAPNRFTLKVISRTLAGSQGLLTGFDPSLNYSWLVFSTDGIAGFNPGRVIIDTSLFANSLDAGSGNGYFFLSQVGNNLFLNFAPVPEPSTYALMAAGLAVAGLRWRRRAPRRDA